MTGGIPDRAGPRFAIEEDFKLSYTFISFTKLWRGLRSVFCLIFPSLLLPLVWDLRTPLYVVCQISPALPCPFVASYVSLRLNISGYTTS
jgi:hypothetical protein